MNLSDRPTAQPESPAADEEIIAGDAETSVYPFLPGLKGEGETGEEGTQATTAQMTLLPGYELLGLLGRGGTSVVYKARHSNLRRLVALKMILGGGHAEPEQLMRFRIEAETVAKLQHPNIVQIYEVGVYESCAYLALEYVEGTTLAETYSGQPVSPLEAARILETVARAVRHAHERGVVHQDLKPANILLTPDGMPKITDFGLARHVGSESMPSLRVNLQGTPAYMAPEQAPLDGEAETAITTAVDIYALGAVLYELLTGQPPFAGSDLRETLRRLREEEPVPPRAHNPAIPTDLELICLKCLQKDPQQRYATAELLAEDLRHFLQDQPILSRPQSLSEFLSRWRRDHPRWATTVVVLFLAFVVSFGIAVGFAWWWHSQWQQEHQVALQSREELSVWQTRVRQLFDCQQTLQQRPEDLDVLWKRAQLFFQLQERQQALADCQTLLGRLGPLDPRRPEVQNLVTKLSSNSRTSSGEVPD